VSLSLSKKVISFVIITQQIYVHFCTSLIERSKSRLQIYHCNKHNNRAVPSFGEIEIFASEISDEGGDKMRQRNNENVNGRMQITYVNTHAIKYRV
jgi:hypothetical protein